MCTERRLLALVALVSAAATSACDATLPAEKGPTVDVRVVAESSVSPAQLATVELLALELSGAESASLFFDGAPVRTRVIRYRPRATSGELVIAASARTSGGGVVASGEARVQLSDGTVAVTLTLAGRPGADLGTPDLGATDLGAPDLATPFGDLAAAAPDLTSAADLAPRPDLAPQPDLASSDLGAAPSLVIGPPNPWTFVGGTQAFAASEPVSWSVDGNGAPISANGVFSAATASPGMYTVRATTIAQPARQATTVITVRSGAIDLVAGKIGAVGSADNAGAYARFKGLMGMAYDGSGTLYLVDNDIVREVDVATAAVRTIAGFPGNSDLRDGIGLEARFCATVGVAIVGAYLYVSDWNCPSIRRVHIATGETITFAGTGDNGTADGTGSSARFQQPWGLTTDGSTLWVADNQALRTIDVALGSPTYGKVTTVLGDNSGGATPFGELTGLAWMGPAPGALFVADQTNRYLFKVTNLGAATPTMVTWAGDGTQGSTDSPLRFRSIEALWATPTRLFFTDLHAVRAVDIANDGSAGAAATIAGNVTTAGLVNAVGTAARFSGVEGLAVAGNTLYVADRDNTVLRAVDLTTTATTTFAGTKSPNATAVDGTSTDAAFIYPMGVAYAGGSIGYVNDRRAIRRVDFTSGSVTTVFGDLTQTGTTDGNGTAARFNALAGLVLVGRTLYATDEANGNIRAANLDTNEVTTFAGDPNGQSGYADGIGTAARFYTPYGIASDGNALYVVASGTNTIRRIDLQTRQVTTLAGSPFSTLVVDGVGAEALLGSTYGIAYEGGALWFASADCIRKLDPATRQVTTMAGCSRDYGDGTGSDAGVDFGGRLMASDGAGHVYLNDPYNGVVRRWDVAWGTLSTIIGTWPQRGLRPLALPSTLNEPTGVALVGPQDFLITDSIEHAVVRVH